MRCNGLAKEGNGVAVLDEDYAKAVGGGVAFHGERHGEVRHGED